MNLDFWLKHPNLITSRINYFIWEKLNPEKPWLTPESVEFCEQNIKHTDNMIEFGSGRSTIWFGEHVAYLTSIEHDEEWYKNVQSRIEAKNLKNISLNLIVLDKSDLPLPNYVKSLELFNDESLDWIIVDGVYRSQCIKFCIPKIKNGGMLLVDDSQYWQSREEMGIPNSWKRVSHSTNGLKWTSIFCKTS